jgi:uncharacterized metal-binding protein
MKENAAANCAMCPFQRAEQLCRNENGKAPEDCATVLYPEQVEDACAALRADAELMRFARESSLQEAACYAPSPYDPDARRPVKPRIMEIIEFAQRMGYHRLGLAFCLGLRTEARELCRILESHGFEVVSVCCKVGRVDKNFLGIRDEEKIKPGPESMCNPVTQAKILNEEKCDFNLMLGLCVGHDSLFLKYLEGLVTVVAVKDRLLGHAPLNALYSNYYAFLKK